MGILTGVNHPAKHLPLPALLSLTEQARADNPKRPSLPVPAPETSVLSILELDSQSEELICVIRQVILREDFA